MTVAVTRNLPERFHGFLCSCMQEIAPGVYVVPNMKKSVREKVWEVMLEWSELIPDEGGIVLFWRNPEAPSELSIRIIGWPKKEFIEYEGLWLTHRSLTQEDQIEELKQLIETEEPKMDQQDPKIE